MQGHYYDEEFDRCINCDCRPWGQWASLPCGTTGIPYGRSPQTWDSFAFKAALYYAAKEATDPDSKPVKFKDMVCHDLAPEGEES